jgi:hypothetical protein
MWNGRYRRARVLFGLSDIALTALAFLAAYETRQWLPFEKVFFLEFPVKVLVLGSGSGCRFMTGSIPGRRASSFAIHSGSADTARWR